MTVLPLSSVSSERPASVPSETVASPPEFRLPDPVAIDLSGPAVPSLSLSLPSLTGVRLGGAIAAAARSGEAAPDPRTHAPAPIPVVVRRFTNPFAEPMRKMMPAIPGMRAESMSVRRDRITLRYSF
jgi:hypothetical protein